MKLSKRIEFYSRASYPALYIPTHEEARIEGEVVEALSAIQDADGNTPEIWWWSCTMGLNCADGRQQDPDITDPLEALGTFINAKKNAVFLLYDIHLFFDDPTPEIIRLFRDAMEHAKSNQKMLIIVGCRLVLPPELEKLVTVLDYDLPTPEELASSVLDPLAVDQGITLEPEQRQSLAVAGSGLTSFEFQDALALSYIETKHTKNEPGFCPAVVYREKVQTVRKSGLVEIVSTELDPHDLGGLDLFKEWMGLRARLFENEARDFGIQSPKGTLLVGVPGSGKSLAAKVCPMMLGGLPLLKLDMGRMFAGIVGASEANMRNVLQLAEAISPCVLWIDEIERGLSGGESSGKTDGGTTDRIIGTLLNWMQEKTKPVFVFATSNDVTGLPPQLLRKGRFDELWFIDLPNETERSEIWEIVVRRSGNQTIKTVKPLVDATAGWTGSEIEALWNEALIEAFAKGEDVKIADVVLLSTKTTPLSKSAASKIANMRKWAETYARPATSPVKTNGKKLGSRSLN